MDDKDCILCDRPARLSGAPGTPDISELTCDVCGTYRITGSLRATILQSPLRDQRWKLAMVTRRSSEAGSPITLKSSNVRELIATAPIVRELPEVMDRLLLYLADHTPSFAEFASVPPNAYPLFGVRSADDLIVAMRWLEKLGYVDAGGGLDGMITPSGWVRAGELRRTSPQGNRAFVAMWFSDDTKDAYENGILPALRNCGYESVRVDRIEHNEKIDDLIIAEIKRSAILVADFTGQRGGVYFEAGFAMGREMPVIRTCRQDQISQVHFDTRQYNHITWESAKELRERLTNRIRATLPTFRVTGEGD
jgi:hypothetical protein